MVTRITASLLVVLGLAGCSSESAEHPASTGEAFSASSGAVVRVSLPAESVAFDLRVTPEALDSLPLYPVPPEAGHEFWKGWAGRQERWVDWAVVLTNRSPDSIEVHHAAVGCMLQLAMLDPSTTAVDTLWKSPVGCDDLTIVSTVGPGTTDTLGVRRLMVREILPDSVSPGRYDFVGYVQLGPVFGPRPGRPRYLSDTTLTVLAGGVEFSPP